MVGLPLPMQSASFFHRELGCFPGVETSRQIAHVREAFALEHTRGQAGAISGGAIEKHGPLAIEFAGTFLQLRKENVDRAGDAAAVARGALEAGRAAARAATAQATRARVGRGPDRFLPKSGRRHGTSGR